MSREYDRLVVGCGYLGLRAALAWKNQGLRVAVTTRSELRAEEFQQLGLSSYVCNVLDRTSLSALPEAEIVLHAVGYDRNSGQSQRQVYVEGLESLLTALSGKYGKFLHVSSTSVYGQSAGEQVDENSETVPSRENGQIVLDAENLIKTSAQEWLIFRFAGIYGPKRLLARISERQQAIPVPGNPDAWLNLIHVEDGVEVLGQGASQPVTREVILVCDDQPVRRRDYYQTLARLLNAPDPEFLTEAADPKGDRGLNKRCQNAKMHKLLSPVLRFPSIEQGLKDSLIDG